MFTFQSGLATFPLNSLGFGLISTRENCVQIVDERMIEREAEWVGVLAWIAQKNSGRCETYRLLRLDFSGISRPLISLVVFVLTCGM